LRAIGVAAIIGGMSSEEPEPLFSRGDLAGTMFNIADIAVDVHAIRLQERRRRLSAPRRLRF
jgi:hypothetical protein